MNKTILFTLILLILPIAAASEFNLTILIAHQGRVKFQLDGMISPALEERDWYEFENGVSIFVTGAFVEFNVGQLQKKLFAFYLLMNFKSTLETKFFVVHFRLRMCR